MQLFICMLLLYLFSMTFSYITFFDTEHVILNTLSQLGKMYAAQKLAKLCTNKINGTAEIKRICYKFWTDKIWLNIKITFCPCHIPCFIHFLACGYCMTETILLFCTNFNSSPLNRKIFNRETRFFLLSWPQPCTGIKFLEYHMVKVAGRSERASRLRQWSWSISKMSLKWYNCS